MGVSGREPPRPEIVGKSAALSVDLDQLFPKLSWKYIEKHDFRVISDDLRDYGVACFG